MKQVVLNIPDNDYPFFMELINKLDFVKINEKPKLTEEQQEFVDGLKHSLEQVDLHLQGKIKLKTAEEFFDEL